MSTLQKLNVIYYSSKSGSDMSKQPYNYSNSQRNSQLNLSTPRCYGSIYFQIIQKCHKPLPPGAFSLEERYNTNTVYYSFMPTSKTMKGTAMTRKSTVPSGPSPCICKETPRADFFIAYIQDIKPGAAYVHHCLCHKRSSTGSTIFHNGNHLEEHSPIGTAKLF